MTRSSREQGHALQEQTKVFYRPLLNLKPSAESTMLTGMLKAGDLSKAAGQEYVVLTLNQQLYRVVLHVLWDDPNRFPNFFLRLGGMHLLMSLFSASSTLLNGSGENEVLGTVFAGITKMLSGKKFTYNVGALWMLVEEVLREQCASRVFKLKSSSRLPSQKLMLTVTANKKQFIDCIVVDLELHKDDFIPDGHFLIVTGSDPTESGHADNPSRSGYHSH